MDQPFAMGGLEAAFFWPTVLGLFWKRANKEGVIASMIGGVGSYLLFGAWDVNILGINNVVFGLLISLICFIFGTYFGKRPDQQTIELFFG